MRESPWPPETYYRNPTNKDQTVHGLLRDAQQNPFVLSGVVGTDLGRLFILIFVHFFIWSIPQ